MKISKFTKEKWKERGFDMKLKSIVNNDTAEIIKKLVHGLDFRANYVIEYLHDDNCACKRG